MVQRLSRMNKTGVQGVSPCVQKIGELARGSNRMALRFFVIPVHDSGAFEQELNGFLASHKVVSIDRPGNQLVLGDLRRLPQPVGSKKSIGKGMRYALS